MNRYKILIAEDDHLNQILISTDLRLKGYDVKIVSNGCEAVEECLSEAYDLVLMDIAMPVMDGIDATKTIRKMGKSTPIIAVTAFDKEDLGHNAESMGINGYLRKPYLREDLYTSVQNMVG